jgi:hypothetical protein
MAAAVASEDARNDRRFNMSSPFRIDDRFA